MYDLPGPRLVYKYIMTLSQKGDVWVSRLNSDIVKVKYQVQAEEWPSILLEYPPRTLTSISSSQHRHLGETKALSLLREL